MSLNHNDKGFCAKAYIRACTALMPKQMFLELKNDLEEQVALTEGNIDENKYQEKRNKELEDILKDLEQLKKLLESDGQEELKEISKDVDDVFQGYKKRRDDDWENTLNQTEDVQVKEILQRYPHFLVEMVDEKLKLFFTKQEYFLTKNDSFSPFGNAYYQLTTQDAETISEAIHAPEFWTWIAAVNSWLNQLSDWQKRITTELQGWEPIEADSLDALKISLDTLKKSLSQPPNPGLPPSVPPTELRGKII
jgi:hypothetical protein